MNVRVIVPSGDVRVTTLSAVGSPEVESCVNTVRTISPFSVVI